MLLAMIVFPMLALLAGLALVVLAPAHERYALVLSAVRTVALVTLATIYTVALFHH